MTTNVDPIIQMHVGTPLNQNIAQGETRFFHFKGTKISDKNEKEFKLKSPYNSREDELNEYEWETTLVEGGPKWAKRLKKVQKF